MQIEPLRWDCGYGPQSVNMPLPLLTCRQGIWTSIERWPVNNTETADGLFSLTRSCFSFVIFAAV